MRTLCLLDDGRILIGGTFNFVNEVARTNIARLLPNGALDTNFNTAVGANGDVAALDLQPDGRIVLAGSFTQVQGVPRAGVARLNADGSLDPAFDPGLGPAGTVAAMRMLPEGGIAVAGRFDTFNGVPRRDLVQLNSGLGLARFTSVTRRADGVAEVQLAGPRCQTYVIEGSTNLQQWVPISTNEVTHGSLLLEDPDARGTVQRFYRAWQVAP